MKRLKAMLVLSDGVSIEQTSVALGSKALEPGGGRVRTNYGGCARVRDYTRVGGGDFGLA